MIEHESTRQDRMNEACDYLKRHHGMFTQKDLAIKVRTTRSVISSALNGDERYLTDNLFSKICAAFPGLFDLQYLLTGEGHLLLEQSIIEENTKPIDQSSLVNACLAAKDDAILALKRELQIKDELISSYRQQLVDKNLIINALNERLSELKRANAENALKYPITPIGVSEDMHDNL